MVSPEVRVRLLKAADRLVGTSLVNLLSLMPRKKGHSDRGIRKVLFIRPGGIGDAVLLLPAVKALRHHIKGVSVDVLCEKRNAGVFDLSDDIGSVYLYDSGGGLLKCLRNTYDIVFDTEQWHRLSAVVALLARAPETVGFHTNERSRLFTRKVAYSHDEYEVESFLRLVEASVGKPIEFDPDKAFLRAPASRVSGALSGQGELVALFPGASVRERHWGSEKYGTVARALQHKGCRVIIVGSHQDAEEAAVIRQRAPEVIDLSGQTSLSDAAAVLQACRLLVTADSGLMHIAAAVGTPTVSLFGAGIQKKWAPRGRSHVILNKGLPCSPCTRFGYTPRCPRGVGCLSLISPDEVVEVAEKVMGRTDVYDERKRGEF